VSLAFTYRNVERKGTSTKMIQKKKEIKRGREGGREKEKSSCEDKRIKWNQTWSHFYLEKRSGSFPTSFRAGVTKAQLGFRKICISEGTEFRLKQSRSQAIYGHATHLSSVMQRPEN
jgi:hypothetical protein